jgi:hypothetical protein
LVGRIDKGSRIDVVWVHPKKTAFGRIIDFGGISGADLSRFGAGDKINVEIFKIKYDP